MSNSPIISIGEATGFVPAPDKKDKPITGCNQMSSGTWGLAVRSGS